MAVVVVVGAQWGDEGKGKVVDHYAEDADVVVRFGGGANAGHTLVLDGQKLVTHLIPSGVLHRGTVCMLGDGMVIEPQPLLEEIAECRSRGLLGDGELVVGQGAHVILPYHKMIEGLREAGSRAIGTTKRGIGPAYEAKAARKGVRIFDLISSGLRDRIEHNLDELGPLIEHYGGTRPTAAEVERMVADAERAGTELAPLMRDVGPMVEEAISAGKNVLMEGAQGALLDIDHGTYPYVTSSATTAAGACQGVGIGPTRIDRVIGISKAYCTRVGEGPFPTEMDDAVADGWRQAGGEFGATTGRPRRCGWLDIPALRRAVRINGMSSVALTKLDVVGGRGDVQVCVGYRHPEGKTWDELPHDSILPEVSPIYETLPGWDSMGDGLTSMGDLPGPARGYVEAIEGWLGIPVSLVSYGPDRLETLVRQPAF